MIAVIFELEPHADQSASYFEWAGALQASLMDVDGFISIERFESVGLLDRAQAPDDSVNALG